MPLLGTLWTPLPPSPSVRRTASEPRAHGRIADDGGTQELRKIYTAPTAEAAFDALAAFAASPLGRKYPQAARIWEAAWDEFTPFLAFTPPVRKLLCTTNSIESLNYQLRKVTKARGHFPGDDAVVKLLWLAIVNIEDKGACEREARRRQTGKRSDQPARLVEGSGGLLTVEKSSRGRVGPVSSLAVMISLRWRHEACGGAGPAGGCRPQGGAVAGADRGERAVSRRRGAR